MRLRFKDASLWQRVVASVEKIIEEGVLIVATNGLSLRALDASHVSMVDMFFPSSAFEDYEVSAKEEVGVSFKLLAQVLKRARKEDELILETKDNKIIIEFAGRGRRIFTIPSIYLNAPSLGEPRIAFTTSAKMLGSTFEEVISILESLSDTIELRSVAGERRLIVSGRGDRVRSVEIALSVEDQTLLEMEAESDDRASYSTEYFSYVLPAASVAEMVTIRFTEDAPVRIDLEYAGGGRLTVYVSPKSD